jgi:hypothetical protein
MPQVYTLISGRVKYGLEIFHRIGKDSPFCRVKILPVQHINEGSQNPNFDHDHFRVLHFFLYRHYTLQSLDFKLGFH